MQKTCKVPDRKYVAVDDDMYMKVYRSIYIDNKKLIK
jgi:hypothetical protein